MANLSEIRTRVGRYVIDLSDETQTELDGFINRACRYAQECHNFRFMEATAAFTTTEATRNLGDKPDDWKEKRTLPWLQEGDGGTREIAWAPGESEMVRLYSEDDPNDIGAPRHILETPDGFKVYPFPDGNSLWDDGEYRVRLPYWKYLPALSEDSDSNWFTENAEDYVVFFATAEGMLFNREEERGAVWAARAGQFDPNTGKFTGELARLVRLDKRSRLSKRLTLIPRRDVYGSTRQGRM